MCARAEVTFPYDDGDEAFEVLTSAETLATLLTLPASDSKKETGAAVRTLSCVCALSLCMCARSAHTYHRQLSLSVRARALSV